MLDYAWIIVFLPALSFVVILLFGKKLPRHGSEIGIAAVGASFVLACIAVVQWISRVENASGSGGFKALGKGFLAKAGAHEVVVKPVVHSVTWWQNGGMKIGAGTQIDGLAVVLLLVVTLVSLLVHIYSTAYMHGDRRFTYFFAALSLFTASMLLLVVADNTLQLLVGWELVGLCSFMLIGHWWEEGVNSDAALKAFFTTRTGDIGLMIGVIVTFFAAGQTFNIVSINEAALAGNGGHAIWLGAAGWDHRQARPFPAPHLASRRDGRSDARVGPDPRRDHGRGRCVPRRPDVRRVLAGVLHPCRWGQRHGPHRWGHDHHRRPAGLRAGRHQEGPRLLDDQPARLHGDGAGSGCVDRRGVPSLHPRLLQGAAVPRGRLDPPLRLAPQLRHEARHGWPAQVHADHVRDVHDRQRSTRRSPTVRGLLLERRDHRHGRALRLHHLPLHRAGRCVPHGGLHDARRVLNVLRRVPRPRGATRVAARHHDPAGLARSHVGAHRLAERDRDPRRGDPAAVRAPVRLPDRRRPPVVRVGHGGDRGARRAGRCRRRLRVLLARRRPRRDRTQPVGTRRLHLPPQQVLPRRPLRTGDRGRHQGPDRPRRVLDESERDRRRRQRGGEGCGRRRTVHLRRHRPTGGRRRGQRCCRGEWRDRGPAPLHAIRPRAVVCGHLVHGGGGAEARADRLQLMEGSTG